jgi:hypothetical protein
MTMHRFAKIEANFLFAPFSFFDAQMMIYA